MRAATSVQSYDLAGHTTAFEINIIGCIQHSLMI